MRVVVSAGVDQVRDIVRAIDEAGHHIEVQSIGRSLEIIKDLGDAHTVNERHGVDRFIGSHGLGHVRLTTESIVDVAYGHPFWAEPFPDISIVHNGQITNYFRFRRLLTQEGYRFHTCNDSELIAVYLADRMLHGETLWDALKTSVDELDGCFAYLFATEDEMGSAKDPLAIKSLVAAKVGRRDGDRDRGAGAAPGLLERARRRPARAALDLRVGQRRRRDHGDRLSGRRRRRPGRDGGHRRRRVAQGPQPRAAPPGDGGRHHASS